MQSKFGLFGATGSKNFRKSTVWEKKERRSNKWDEASFKESFLESIFKHTVGEG